VLTENEVRKEEKKMKTLVAVVAEEEEVVVVVVENGLKKERLNFLLHLLVALIPFHLIPIQDLLLNHWYIFWLYCCCYSHCC
jgi:hypothetical protein